MDVIESHAKPSDDFEVWPENAETVGFFLRLQTQWRLAPSGHFVGLDYTATKATLDLLSPDDPRAVFDGLQIMEAAALKVLNGKD